MKVGSVVVSLQVVAAVVAFSLTQGCVTTDAPESGLGAGARHQGIVRHAHKKAPVASATVTKGTGMEYYPEDVMGPSIIGSPMIEDGPAKGSPYFPEEQGRPVQSTQTYIVQSGDILSKIAKKFNTTTSELVRQNNLSNPDVLYVGQELRIPSGSHSATGSSSAPTSSVKKGGEYMIQKGDTLSGIAVSAGVSIDDLRSLNKIKDDKIFAGEKLAIPAGGKIPSQKPKVSPATKPAAKPVAKPELPPVQVAPVNVGVPSVLEPEVAPPVGAVMEYVAYPDETVEDIALRNMVSVNEIMRLNPELVDPSQKLKRGQRLRIPIAE